MTLTKLAITGIGAVTPYGLGWECATQGIIKRRTAVRKFSGQDIAPEEVTWSLAPVDSQLRIAEKLGIKPPHPVPSTQFLLGAVAEALADAGSLATQDQARIGVVVDYPSGSAWTVVKMMEPVLQHGVRKARPALFTQSVANAAAGEVARHFGLRGSNIVTAGGSGLDIAVTMLRCGEMDSVVYAGVHKIVREHMIALMDQGVIGLDKELDEFLPYSSKSVSLAVGEGAVAIVVQRLQDDISGSAKIYAELIDVSSGPVFPISMVPSKPSGWGSLDSSRMSSLVQELFDKAGLASQSIDLWYGSGNGNPVCDEAEMDAIRALKLDNTQVVSIKRYLGETFGMAFPASLAWAASGLDPSAASFRNSGLSIVVNIEPYSFMSAGLVRSGNVVRGLLNGRHQ